MRFKKLDNLKDVNHIGQSEVSDIATICERLKVKNNPARYMQTDISY